MKIKLTEGIVEAELLEKTPKGGNFKLADGHIIHRKDKDILWQK